MRFLGLKIGDKVPNGNTIWNFKEALKENEVDRKLFDLFNKKLEAQGIVTHNGSIVDASFVTVPKCHTTKKDDESFFSFKDHVKCDSNSKIITNFSVKDASVHDSQKSVGLIDEKDYEVKVGSGYVGEKSREEILAKYSHIKLHICANPFRNTPLTDEDKEKNKAIAHTRARVEHIFEYMTRFMVHARTDCRIMCLMVWNGHDWSG